MHTDHDPDRLQASGGTLPLVLRVVECVQQVGESPGPATVLRGSGALAVEQGRVALPGVRGEDGLEHHIVFPPVSEVVGVGHALPGRAHDLMDARPPGLSSLPESGHGFSVAIGCVAVLEAEEVAVLPTERCLEHPMELCEGEARGDLDAAPDGRRHLLESDPELVQGVGSRRRIFASVALAHRC
jgi:hypothetical protein